jgi:8-oxo-dGTP pyrophosphatase MutT (NUDIX family)
MNSGINLILQRIYDQLPLFAEEGGDYTSAHTQDMVSSFDMSEQEAAHTAVHLVQALFCTLGVLDQSILANNIWRFVSSPASLLARSTLNSLADSQQFLFDDGFWQQHDSSSPVSDQQRNFLQTIENRRTAHHKTTPEPIRYVHVAWGLIVVDGKVLMRHREDKNREAQNNYVLVGGRLSQHDLKKADNNLSNSEALAMLQSPSASDKRTAIENALIRELNEETGLSVEAHYNFTPWRTIKPYAAVEGAGANHALTEYRIHVFHIQLTLDGLFQLARQYEQDPNLTWFDLGELEQARSIDGKMAYIDALIADYPTPQQWQAALKLIEASYQSRYPLDHDTHAITLPPAIDQPLLCGKTGKEQKIAVALNTEDLSLLTSLCLYAKYPDSKLSYDTITALPNAWLEVKDPAMQVALKELAIKLQQAGCSIVEGYKEQYYRCALAPEHIYFDDTLFSYTLSSSGVGSSVKTDLVIKRSNIAIDVKFDLITAEPSSVTKPLSIGLNSGLAKITKGVDIDPGVMESINKGLRRDLGPLCRSIGLRRIVRTINNTPTIAIRLE